MYLLRCGFPVLQLWSFYACRISLNSSQPIPVEISQENYYGILKQIDGFSFLSQDSNLVIKSPMGFLYYYQFNIILIYLLFWVGKFWASLSLPTHSRLCYHFLCTCFIPSFEFWCKPTSWTVQPYSLLKRDLTKGIFLPYEGRQVGGRVLNYYPLASLVFIQPFIPS